MTCKERIRYFWWKLGEKRHQRKQAKLYKKAEGIPFVDGDPIILEAMVFIDPHKGINMKMVYYNGIFVRHLDNGYIEWTGFDGSTRAPWHFSTVRKDISNQLEKYERT